MQQPPDRESFQHNARYPPHLKTYAFVQILATFLPAQASARTL